MRFGAANSAAHQETTLNVENKQEVDDGSIKSLEGYFDNLAASAVNEKSVLDQLVANKTKIAANNESLVTMVKKLTGDIKNMECDNSHLNKGGQVSVRGPALCHPYKKEGYHQTDACYKLAKNKDKLPPGWRSSL